jgi:glycosyltransferase involved in cell wall biosynthesis
MLPQEAAEKPAAGVVPADFKRRWAKTLQGHPDANPSVHAVMDVGISGRVLFVDQQIPRGDMDAGSYAAIQEMRLFQSLGYKVTFLPMNLMHGAVYTDALQRMGVETIHAPFASSVEDVFRERGTEFDCVYITRYHVARSVLPFVRRFNPRAKVIFNNADLHFLRELRTALAKKDETLLRRSELTRTHELEVMRRCDLTLTYSDVERAVVESHNRDQTKIAKAPWVVAPAASIPEFSARRDLMFIGSFGHQPNVDAMRFFVSEVMPMLRSALPGLSLLIYGSQMTPEIKQFESSDIKIKGHVENLGSAFDSARLFVAPLMAGAGVKGKVLSAMSYGVPTVLTNVAAEAIGVQASVHYAAADSAVEMTKTIQSLYHDEARWNAISAASLSFVRSHFSFEKGQATLRRALESIDIFPTASSTALCCKAPLPPLT